VGDGSGLDAPAGRERRLVGEGREAEILDWDSGRVVRLLRDPEASERARVEAEAMAAARAAGAAAPAVHEVVELEGRPGIVVDRIDGPDLLTIVARRPWSVSTAGRTLGEVHARIHAVAAPHSLPEISDVIRDRLRTADTATAELAGFALEHLDALSGGDRLLHGDLHPANILVGPEGPVAIDWMWAGCGDPAADVAWTRLLLRLARPHSSSPWIVRKGHGVGRGLMESGYVKAYGRARAIDIELVDRWEPVLAVARLASDLEGERPALLALLRGAGAPVPPA
jgi:aminoglycoside phosphotransferase (APT) family kinase protein